VPEAIAAAEVVRAALLGDERGEVGVVFDALTAIVGARMARDFGAAVQETHLVFGGDEGERAAEARSRETGGSGLGLTIVRSVVVAHGGTLSLESAPKAGSRFTVRLAAA
jgi:two-component system sensor histidine kinase BaeS